MTITKTFIKILLNPELGNSNNYASKKLISCPNFRDSNKITFKDTNNLNSIYTKNSSAPTIKI